MGRRSGALRRVLAAGAALLLSCVAMPAHPATQSASLAAIKAEISLRDFDAAAAGLRRLAADDNREAEYLLGVFYLQGLDGPSAPDLARQWLEKAAAQGEARAAFTLAALASQATPADQADAARWLARAHELGYKPSQTAVRRSEVSPWSADPDLAAVALWRAIERGDLASARELASRSSIAATDEFGRGALARAAAAGHSDAVALLVERGAAVGIPDRYGATPLMLAVDSGRVAAVQELLHAGAPVNAADHAGNTALMRAARRGDMRILQDLLAAGASVTPRNVQDWSALDFALASGAAQCASLLRERGASAVAHGTVAQEVIASVRHPAPPHADLYFGWPDIAVAASRNSSQLIRVTLGQGASLAAATPDGTPVLTIAAESGAADSVKALLAARGARGLDARGGAALIAAIRSDRPAAVSALLTAGVSPDATSGETVSPLILAARSGNEAIIHALLAARVRVDVQDERGITALMLLSRRGDIEGARGLLAAGASTEIRDRDGRTALWYAAYAGELPMVRVLAAHGAQTDATDRTGLTALAAACLSGAGETVTWLAAHGARIDARTRAGDTALLLAAGRGHVDVVAKLLSLHADKDARNSFGDTALIIASRNGNLSIVRQLLAAGAATSLRNRDRFTAADIAAARSFSNIAAQLHAGS